MPAPGGGPIRVEVLDNGWFHAGRLTNCVGQCFEVVSVRNRSRKPAGVTQYFPAAWHRQTQCVFFAQVV